MRTVRISEEVWQAIAGRGKFGETEDDVLRRVFQIPANTIEGGPTKTNNRVMNFRNSSGLRRRFAEKRMTAYIDGDKLHVEFEDGNHSEWPLPDRNDKAEISAITHNAISWARNHGATLGQENYVRQVLTRNDYHITK
jgi:hypothetical protein